MKYISLKLIVEDIPDVIKLMRNLPNESTLYANYPNDDDAADAVASVLERMVSSGLVHGRICVDRTGDTVGFMLVSTSCEWYNPSVIVSNEMMLYVRPDNRGCVRSAVSLIKKVVEDCRDKSSTRLAVGSSLGINDDGVERLYKLCGFTPARYGLEYVIVHRT